MPNKGVLSLQFSDDRQEAVNQAVSQQKPGIISTVVVGTATMISVMIMWVGLLETKKHWQVRSLLKKDPEVLESLNERSEFEAFAVSKLNFATDVERASILSGLPSGQVDAETLRVSRAKVEAVIADVSGAEMAFGFFLITSAVGTWYLASIFL